MIIFLIIDVAFFLIVELYIYIYWSILVIDNYGNYKSLIIFIFVIKLN